MGNKALARELSITGHVHTKPAHGKAQESIYRQRFVSRLDNCLLRTRRQMKPHLLTHIF